jgi:hypothetical protein
VPIVLTCAAANMASARNPNSRFIMNSLSLRALG